MQIPDQIVWGSVLPASTALTGKNLLTHKLYPLRVDDAEKLFRLFRPS
jgi:hypothetical protein